MLSRRIKFQADDITKYFYNILYRPYEICVNRVCVILDISESMGCMEGERSRLDIAKFYINILCEYFGDVWIAPFSKIAYETFQYTKGMKIELATETYYECVDEIIMREKDNFDMFVLMSDGLPSAKHSGHIKKVKDLLISLQKKMCAFTITCNGSGEYARDFSTPYPFGDLVGIFQRGMFINLIKDAINMEVIKLYNNYVICNPATGVGHFISETYYGDESITDVMTMGDVLKFADLEIMDYIVGIETDLNHLIGVLFINEYCDIDDFIRYRSKMEIIKQVNDDNNKISRMYSSVKYEYEDNMKTEPCTLQQAGEYPTFCTMYCEV